jgi:hypothetical protein
VKRKLAWLIVAFALLVTGIESLKILAAWWQADRPTPGMAELLSFLALGVVAVAWWRVSIFRCPDDSCRVRPRD